jgi:hypothetical protein
MSNSSQGGGAYQNTSKDRIKDTLAKAQFLLDDPFSGGAVGNQDTTSNFGYGGADYGRGNIGGMGQPMLNKGYSQPPPL